MDKYLYKSPLGYLLLEGNAEYISCLRFIDNESDLNISSIKPYGEIEKAIYQMDEYFIGNLKYFDLNLKLDSTPFRKKVWSALQTIPYGKTITYQELATTIGNPKATRAVGGANHHNNIAIIIPCHRVCGKNGTLTGYAGGLDRKEWLLNHEEKYKHKNS